MTRQHLARSECARLTALMGVMLPGCVHIYHPLTSFQRPVAISVKRQNFKGVTMSLDCVRSPALVRARADALCEKVGAMFEGQGATIVDEESDSDSDAAPSEATPVQLHIQFKTDKIYENNNVWMWVIAVPTFTIFPVKEEVVLAQHVRVRGANNFVLAEETLDARFVTYFGAGYWLVNQALNVTLRSPAEEISESRVSADFSRDFYGRVSQIVYNAKMRGESLSLSRAETK